MDDDDALRPAELARKRRRDRDASAAERAGMRTGLAKTMKQIMDAQARRGAEARRALEGGAASPGPSGSDATTPEDRGRGGKRHDPDGDATGPG